MGIEYVVYSPLTAKKLEKVIERCEKRIEGWYDIRADYDDQWGELSLAGDIPSEDEAREMILADEEDGEESGREILARLPTIKAAINIDRPGDFEMSPTQVSIMRFLLENAGKGLVQMVDGLQTSEEVLDELGDYFDVEQTTQPIPEEPDTGPPPPGASGAVLMRFVAAQTKKAIESGAFELHPLANPKALAEDILDYLYAKDKRPTAAEFIEWLINRGDIEEVYGDDAEIYGQFIAS